MIPLLAAREVRDTLLDYLRSTWQLADRHLEKALLAFLAGEHGMFKGPWVRIALPFALAPEDAPIPLDIRPPYRPYLHQLLAWQRLSSRAGHEPEATIVTTGTGSGKTECFLYPILDHAARALSRGEKGIKALVLYPMNALAADQARRMAAVVHGDDRLRGRLRIGMFVGGNGRNREMGPSHVIDDNDHLRRHPPDILLTNYRMLDLLLQRPRDAGLWAQNVPGRLRYLVLDELHTYDGAQGTDVACLVRRLGARLGGADAICPVGTSATVTSSTGDTAGELLAFARRIFDHPFVDDALVGESRLSAEQLFEAFGPEGEAMLPTSLAALEPEPQEEAEAHVRAVAHAWFPSVVATAAPGNDFRVRLGEAVLRHPLARSLVRVTAQRLASWEAIVAEMRQGEALLADRAPAEAERALTSLVTLLSWSKRKVGSRHVPLVSVQVQLWVREARRLLREVSDVPRFRWLDDGPGPEGTAALPMVYCRECGHAGWVTARQGLGDRVSLEYADIARAVDQRDADVAYVHQDGSVRGDDGTAPPRLVFDPRTAELLPARELREGRIAVYVQQDARAGSSGRGRQRCPACGADDAMRFLASRNASLTSVAVGHLFTTPLNTDRKLLAFSDSVQDASHRAGFFGGRTYRFALRSAMLAVVPPEGGMPLAAIGPAMRAHWPSRLAAGRWDPDVAFVGAFLPQDLEFLAAYVDWEAALAEHQAKKRETETRGETFGEPLPVPSPALVEDVASRLRWEVARELGVAARIGRTLEQSGCLAVTLDPARFQRAVDRAAVTLPERLGVLHGVGRAAFAALIAGLVTRVRLRGGILDPFLEKYVASGGTGYMLSKEQAPLLSPFGRFTTRPVFLTSEPKPRRFDSVQPAERRTWFTDWIGRVLGLELGLPEARDVGMALLPVLVEAGLFGERASGPKYRVWGLDPEALVVSRTHAWRRCAACGYEISAVPESPTDPIGAPCLRYRCEGRFEVVAEDASRTATYYRRYYERGALGRVWPREHTGLLPREEREDLEIEFKERPRPNSPNLLSCTPTLEMGIDIGDLSATLLCSVPPGPASYVQRVGRAGRETGNALILSFAASRPHDLYYFEDPLALMAGAIHPPGCYLDAPEVLKRQALAFCFDRLAREGYKMPGRLREALAESAESRFPQAALEAIAERRTELRRGFLELFARQLAGESRKRLEAFFEPGGDGLSPIESRLATEVAHARERREELRRQVKRLDGRIEKIQKDEAERKKLENPEQELADLGFERRYALAELKAFLDQDLWGFFCDRSLLPNFAFPEAGVRLDAFVRREGMKNGIVAEPEHRQWVRPPAAAIAELAPFNTFYGSGRQVVVQNIDLRHGGAPAEWQLCSECHHMQEVAKLSDPPPPTCPACGASGWGEVGRRRWLAPMMHVRAYARHRDALVGDEREDRERAFYEADNFYDAAGSTPSPVWVNPSKGMGFELLPRITLRRINFGRRDAQANSVRVAGRMLPEVRFLVCAECGQVQPSEPTPGWAAHWPSCAQRKQPKEKQSIREMHLFRQLESEALRLVVPISEHEWSRRLPNLRAALRLGLRLHFGGDPDFLMVDSYDEPLPGGEGRRRYVVVLDLVPGGTGMLVDLAQDKGRNLQQVLQRARDALLRCPCNQRDREVRACHLCLLAYRELSRRDEEPAAVVLDREVALAELTALLGAFDGLEQAAGVGTLNQEHVLESELERRLIARLDAWTREQPGTSLARLDMGRWRLSLGDRRWLVRAQVDVDETTAQYACRPDLLFYPEGQDRGVLPVAVFADGVAYHVQPDKPRSRIEDDLRKRHGLVRPGRFLTWSITWRDLNEHETGAIGEGVPPWLPDAETLARAKILAQKLGIEGLLPVLDRDPLTGLLAHLREPRKLGELAAVAVVTLIHLRGQQITAVEAAQQHHRVRTAERLDMSRSEATTGGDTAFAKIVMGAENEAMLVVSVPREVLGTLRAQPERATLTLRLEDGAEQRSRPQFQTAWRQLLRAWNLLQALPGTFITSFEQIEDAAAPVVRLYPEHAPSVGGLLRAAERVNGRRGALPDDVDERIAEIGDERAREAVRAVVRRGAVVPEIPYELRLPKRGAVGDVEIGWAARRVGAYLDHQRETAERLRADGWTLFPIERGLTEVELARALGIEEG
ncbi:DEAD/DEAH box helicase [Sorangium sp. So ce1335]|uniref:DEAD/DEAH box helicase n=1 Tax=Sorangium sp. So ce1335 TaxID=3133335 RepID=UPI003F622F54